MKIKNLFYLFAVTILSLSFMTCDAYGKKDEIQPEKENISIYKNTTFHIIYEITDEKGEGTLDMFVKGKNAKVDIKTKENGQDVSTLMYIKDGMMYMIMDMMDKKIGIKMDVSKDENFQKDFAKLYDAKVHLKDYTKVGSEDVLGYKCDIFIKGAEKIWIYTDMIALKFTDGKSTLEAKEFEPDAKLADDFFDPPKDIEFKSMDDLKNLGQ